MEDSRLNCLPSGVITAKQTETKDGTTTQVDFSSDLIIKLADGDEDAMQSVRNLFDMLFGPATKA